MRITTKDRGLTRQDRAQRLYGRYQTMSPADQDAAASVHLGTHDSPCANCGEYGFDHGRSDIGWCVAYAIIDKVDSQKVPA